jgi:hypothetical protein
MADSSLGPEPGPGRMNGYIDTAFPYENATQFEALISKSYGKGCVRAWRPRLCIVSYPGEMSPSLVRQVRPRDGYLTGE